MFFLYPYIKKMKGEKVGLIQEWRLFDILAFKVGTFFGGGHLLESELQLPKMWQSEYQKSCTWYKPEARNSIVIELK